MLCGRPARPCFPASKQPRQGRKERARGGLLVRSHGPWCYETPVHTQQQTPVHRQWRVETLCSNTNFPCSTTARSRTRDMRQKMQRNQLNQHRGPPETSIVRSNAIHCHHVNAQNHTSITMSCIIAKQTRNASFDASNDATMQSTSSGCDTCPRREESFSKRRIPRVLTKPPAIQTNAHAFLKAVMIGDTHVREKT